MTVSWKKTESYKENLELLCYVPQCWRFHFCLVRKCAGHLSFQLILPGRACCTDSQVCVPGWCCTDLVRGPGCLLCEGFVPWNLSCLFGGVRGKKTTPRSPAPEMSDVVIDQSADSDGACLLHFSPRGPGGTWKCAMFRFPQAVFAALALPPSSWRNGRCVPFCGCWPPTRRTFNRANADPLCLSQRKVQAVFQALVWTQRGRGSPGPAGDRGWWHHKLNILAGLLIWSHFPEPVLGNSAGSGTWMLSGLQEYWDPATLHWPVVLHPFTNESLSGRDISRGAHFEGPRFELSLS